MGSEGGAEGGGGEEMKSGERGGKAKRKAKKKKGFRQLCSCLFTPSGCNTAIAGLRKKT